MVSESAQERSNLIIPLMIIAGILPVVGAALVVSRSQRCCRFLPRRRSPPRPRPMFQI